MIGQRKEKKKLNLETMEYDITYTYFVDGKEVAQEEYEAAFPDKPITPFGIEANWRQPVDSFAAGCHPKRAKEFEAYMAKQGVPTDFTTNRGRPIFTSRAHQLKALKALQMHNQDEVRG